MDRKWLKSPLSMNRRKWTHTPCVCMLMLVHVSLCISICLAVCACLWACMRVRVWLCCCEWVHCDKKTQQQLCQQPKIGLQMAMPVCIFFKFSGQIHTHQKLIRNDVKFLVFYIRVFLCVSRLARSSSCTHALSLPLPHLWSFDRSFELSVSVPECACAYVYLVFCVFASSFFCKYVCERVLYACIAFDAHSLTQYTLHFVRQMLCMILLLYYYNHYATSVWSLLSWRKCLPFTFTHAQYTFIFKVRYRRYSKGYFHQAKNKENPFTNVINGIGRNDGQLLK